MSDTARLIKQTKPTGFTRRTDWSLVFGAGLVFLILLLAVFGPLISPHDPLQENYIFKTAAGFKAPPLPAFQLSSFPLGSDEFGRDVLSRLLWGVQPTMTLVLVVVAIRLILGTG
ncbi:MAG: hypothetical protein HGA53_00385, partial [Anaerolineaceae bacterium]|nr:hypothetical protein [Anaerolineaceae bacterium]